MEGGLVKESRGAWGQAGRLITNDLMRAVNKNRLIPSGSLIDFFSNASQGSARNDCTRNAVSNVTFLIA